MLLLLLLLLPSGLWLWSCSFLLLRVYTNTNTHTAVASTTGRQPKGIDWTFSFSSCSWSHGHANNKTIQRTTTRTHSRVEYFCHFYSSFPVVLFSLVVAFWKRLRCMSCGSECGRRPKKVPSLVWVVPMLRWRAMFSNFFVFNSWLFFLV